MAPPARLELTTLRLGGVRSILVSYGGILNHYIPVYCTQRISSCQGKAAHFLPLMEYTAMESLERGNSMRESNDPRADLDDLIFDKDDGGPSER